VGTVPGMATMRRVDLDDVDDEHGHDERPRRRRRLWVVAALVAAVAAALGGAQLVVDARHRAYAVQFDGLPGAVWKLDDPAPRWPVQIYDGRANGARVRDTIVSAFVTEDGDVTISGVALRTGTARWTTHVQTPAEVVADFRRGEQDSFSRGVECRTSARRGEPEALAVCVVGVEPPGVHSESGRRALLVAVDDAGRVRTQRVVPDAFWTTRGTHVVLATIPRPGHRDTITVTEQTVEGQAVWSRTLGAGDAVDASEAAEEIFGTDLTTDGTWTAVHTGTRAFVLDENGEVVGDVATGGGTGASLVAGGALWLWDYEDERPGRLVLPGAPGLALPAHSGDAQPVTVAVDDGSVPGLLPVQVGHSVFAIDARTGDRLWSTSTPADVAGAVILDGVVYVSAGDRVIAADARTGQERWTTRLPLGAGTLTTDGRRLVVASQGVTLLDIDDGTVVRQLDAAALTPPQLEVAEDVVVYCRYGVLVMQVTTDDAPGTDLWVIS